MPSLPQSQIDYWKAQDMTWLCHHSISKYHATQINPCRIEEIWCVSSLSNVRTLIFFNMLLILCSFAQPVPVSHYETCLYTLWTSRNEKQRNSDLITTLDLNFADTKWKTVYSKTPYEEEILEKPIEMSEQVASQHDSVLWNSNEINKHCRTDRLLNSGSTRNNKYFSHHSPLRFEMILMVKQLPNAAAKRYAFTKPDRRRYSEAIGTKPFQPYCYSNVDYLVNLWYEWEGEKVDANVPGVTWHCAALHTRILLFTSSRIKLLNTMKRENNPNLTSNFKKKKLEKQIYKEMENHLRKLENQFLRAELSAKFSDIWKTYVKLQLSHLLKTLETSSLQSKQKNVIC